jgi:plasmid stabilization system protein ParE
MERNTFEIILSPKAKKEFIQAIQYIEEKGYPMTGKKYELRMENFIRSLSFMPHKYAICRQQRFARWQFRCATFENTYIIVYKIEMAHLTVKRIIHGKQIK